MTVIRVPTMGTIRIRRAGLEKKDGSFRRYRRVAFRLESGAENAYYIGSPSFRFGVDEEFCLYDTVCAALSFYADDDSSDSSDWETMAQIPYGTIRVIRDEYRVIDDGNGGSDRTPGKQRKRTIKVDRFSGESSADALMRSLAEWDGWKDDHYESFGTFDCPAGDSWHTVPVRHFRGKNEWCVSHSLWIKGDIARDIPEMIRDLKSCGAAW